MSIADTNTYKKEIAEHYTKRSNVYDNSAWHKRIAKKLVDYTDIKVDSRILDIGTGTGMVAFYAASKLGPQGSVIGIDISRGMIEIAQEKLQKAKLSNVSFDIGDGEELKYEPDSFDIIFCSSAFIWMTDLHTSLVHWRSRLKPGGKLGLHAFSENAFVTGAVAQSVLQKYGINYLMSKPTGTVDKCKNLLNKAGFRNIEIKVDTDGSFITLEDAKNSWVNTSHPAPGQFPHPLVNLSSEELSSARADYDRELEKLNTNNGIWNDMTTFYVYGEK